MSRCNYCDWQRLKGLGYRKATEDERKILWDTDDPSFGEQMGAGVVIVDKHGKFAAWFMELPDHCTC